MKINSSKGSIKYHLNTTSGRQAKASLDSHNLHRARVFRHARRAQAWAPHGPAAAERTKQMTSGRAGSCAVAYGLASSEQAGICRCKIRQGA